MRILLVDDDLFVLAALVRLLARDMEVVAVSSSARAVDLLRDGCFDALVTDNDMPGMGGVALLERARALRPEMRRVLVSAREPDDVEALLTSGLTHAFLLKPYSKEELLLACCEAARAVAVP